MGEVGLVHVLFMEWPISCRSAALTNKNNIRNQNFALTVSEARSKKVTRHKS